MLPLARLALSAALCAAPALAQEAGRWGPALDDPGRYHGLYDSPEGDTWFVAESEPPMGMEMQIPPGHLMIGATFGDVAPYFLRTESETRFLRPGYNEYNPDIVVEFDLPDTGPATALSFTFGDREPESWVRTGDLPESWQ